MAATELSVHFAKPQQHWKCRRRINNAASVRLIPVGERRQYDDAEDMAILRSTVCDFHISKSSRDFYVVHWDKYLSF